MKPLVIISGPTAAGKTKLSVSLAKRINGEIISADSMQVYRGMDIGSAKVTEEEKENIEHHLIDILDPTEDFNVATFKRMAEEAIDKVLSKGKIPIVVGGTGFYIRALLYDADFDESQGEISAVRSRLEDLSQTKGADYLFEILKSVDPESAETIHKNNVKRVIRALEFYEETGEKISSHNEKMHEKESPYNFAYFVLTKNRDELYNGIEKRIDKMLEDGLLDEVKKLKDQGLTRENNSMQGLGYKEILDYFDNITTLEEAIYILKRDTRHFAKRQLTWFRREKEIIMFNKSEYDSEDLILNEMIECLKAKEIING